MTRPSEHGKWAPCIGASNFKQTVQGRTVSECPESWREMIAAIEVEMHPAKVIAVVEDPLTGVLTFGLDDGVKVEL